MNSKGGYATCGMTGLSRESPPAFGGSSKAIRVTRRSLGSGLLEMRVDYGPGYRVYHVHRGAVIVVLLCGGDKRTQQHDIKRALALAVALEE